MIPTTNNSSAKYFKIRRYGFKQLVLFDNNRHAT